MKNLLLIILAILSLSFISCEKEDDVTPNVDTTTVDYAVIDVLPDADTNVERDYTTDPVTPTDDYSTFTVEVGKEWSGINRFTVDVLTNDNLTADELIDKSSGTDDELIIRSRTVKLNGVDANDLFDIVTNTWRNSDLIYNSKIFIGPNFNGSSYDVVPSGVYEISVEYEYKLWGPEHVSTFNNKVFSATSYTTVTVL